MNSLSRYLSLAIIFLFLLPGCSNPGNPSDPGLEGEAEIRLQQDDPQLTGSNPDVRDVDDAYGSHTLLGYFNCFFDRDTGTIEVIPMRNMGMHLNVLGYLEVFPCTDCLTIQLKGPTGTGTILVDVTIDNPFPNAKLTVFDVRGIIMFDGSLSFPEFGLTVPDINTTDGAIANAEGYTALYNATTIGQDPSGIQSYIPGKLSTIIPPNALVNGYKKFISDDPLNTRNAFYSGNSVTVEYEIRPMGFTQPFGYAIDANWAKPLVDPVIDPITDFPPKANCPEPWMVEVTEEPIGAGLTDQGGSTVLHIDVYDWQGKESYVAPMVECPGLFTGLKIATWAEDGPDYSRWDVTVENELLVGIGSYECLIVVVDNDNATAPEWLDLTAYQLVVLIVEEVANTSPTAAAHSDKSLAEPDELISFFDDSTDPNGAEDINKWEWDFSYDELDGFQVDSEDQNPTHSYPAEGEYPVQLRVTDTALNSDMLDDPLLITVSVWNLPPTAAAHSDKSLAEPDELISFFDDSTDPNGAEDINKWEWDFSYDELDGFQVDSEDQNPTHSYPAEGEYQVQLRVTDTALNPDMLDDPLLITIGIWNLPPTAAAHADKTMVYPDEVVSFFDDSTDPNGVEDIIKWEWDFSYDELDGFQVDSEDQNPTHSYPAEGEYLVQLRVTDTALNPDKLDDPLIITVGIWNLPPTAAAHSDKTLAEPDELISFFDDSTDPNGVEDITKWEWDFSYDELDGFQVDSEDQNPTHSYPAEGEYQVQLRVTDTADNTDMLDTPIEIQISIEFFDPLAFADLDPPVQVVCEPVHFFDDGSYDPDGGLIVLYEWDWDNDGVFEETGDDVYHTWNEIGHFDVQFRVTDDEGAVGELQDLLQVDIVSATPSAVAEADEYTIMPGEMVNFTGSDSTDNDCGGQEIVLWEWDLDGDGTFEKVGENVSKIYDVEGEYHVQLKVTDDENDQDDLDEPLIITVSGILPPVALANVSPEGWYVCKEFHFTDDGSYDPDGGLIVLYEWDWDMDGVYDDTGPDVYHSWDTMGIYDIQMRVTDDEGQTDTLDEPLQVDVGNSGPEAMAEADNYFPQVGESVNFDGSGSYDTDCDNQYIELWEWDFDLTGDFTVDDTGEYVSHAYGTSGAYKVKLRVKDNEGDYAYATNVNINVAQGPSAPTALATNDIEKIPVGGWVNFDDQSIDPDGDIVLYEWDFSYDPAAGFVTENLEEDPSWQFNTPGTFHVHHRVTDATALFDLINFTITIIVSDVPLSDKPFVFIACPDWNVTTWNFYFNWNMGDDVTPKDNLLVRVWKGSEGPFELPPGTWQWNWQGPIACGNHTFYVEVEDEDGIKKLAYCDWSKWDDEDPEVTFTYCPSTPTSNPWFSFYYYDDCTPSDEMLLWISRDYGLWEPIPSGTHEYYDWGSVYCPDHSFRVKAQDLLGNETIGECLFNGADNAPVLELTNCPGQTGSSYNFIWTLDDQCTPLGELVVEYWYDNSGWLPLPPGSLSYLWNNIPCGPHDFGVKVKDGAGLIDEEWCLFDGPGEDLDPTVSITNCVPQTASSHIFEWTMDDDCTPTEWMGVHIRLDYKDPWIQLPDGILSYTWNDINCGAHVFEVHVGDFNGNVAVDECFFQGPGEDLEPIIAFTNCPTSIAGHEFTFEWTLWDDCIPIEELAVDWMVTGDIEWTGLEPGTTSLNLTDIPCDIDLFKVRVWDFNDAHDPVEATCHFDLIGDDPQVWWVPSCPDNVLVENFTIDWDYFVDCMNPGWATVEIRKDSEPWEELDPGTKQYVWEGLTIGPHTFLIKVTDEWGRWALSVCDFDRI